jgi:hypothetical protein
VPHTLCRSGSGLPRTETCANARPSYTSSDGQASGPQCTPRRVLLHSGSLGWTRRPDWPTRCILAGAKQRRQPSVVERKQPSVEERPYSLTPELPKQPSVEESPYSLTSELPNLTSQRRPGPRGRSDEDEHKRLRMSGPLGGMAQGRARDLAASRRRWLRLWAMPRQQPAGCSRQG